MKHFIILALCLFLIVSIVGCNSYNSVSISNDDNTLPAIELTKDNTFSPDGGTTIEEAKDLISDYLLQNGKSGNVRSSLILHEITAKEVWENDSVQIYRANLDYAWLDGVAVVKDKKVLCILDGMPTHNIFLDDLDKDGHYEVYSNISMGSGFVSREIRGYNISTGKNYSMSKRAQIDLTLFIKDKKLWVEESTYNKQQLVSLNLLSISKSNELELVKRGEGNIVQLFLPKLKETYNSAYEHWDELNLENISLMDKPLLEAEDIISIDENEIKLKKNFEIVNGHGMDNGLIYDDKQQRILEYVYNNVKFDVERNSPDLFYIYNMHGICIVNNEDNIFLVKQREYQKSTSSLDRKYMTGPVGVPYVLVVNGRKTELGVLQVAKGEFALPESIDSWCYMGFPDHLPVIIPEGNTLKR